MFDILSLVTVEKRDVPDGRVWYALDPDVLYPAAAAYITEHAADFTTYANAMNDGDLVAKALKGDWLAAFTLKARTTMREVVSVPAEAWELVTVARDATAPEEVKLRAAALEATRMFFTEALHQAADKPIGVHILRNEAYRL